MGNYRQPARHAPDRMTRAYNVMQAFSKVTIAPLHTLTDDRLESIANCHASGRDRAALLVELHARLAERKRREAANG